MNQLMISLSRYSLCWLLGFSMLAGCAGKDGEPGPKGDAGAAGAKGPQGALGQSGEQMIKSGNVTGKVTGSRADGTAVDEAFKFEFGFSNNPVTFTELANGKYSFIIIRFDSLRNGTLYMSFETDKDFSNARFAYGNFYSQKITAANEYLRIDANHQYYTNNSTYTPASVTATISGVSFNKSSGMLTGTFSWNVDNTSKMESGVSYVNYQNKSGSGKPLQITGTFSIPTRERTYRVKVNE